MDEEPLRGNATVNSLYYYIINIDFIFVWNGISFPQHISLARSSIVGTSAKCLVADVDYKQSLSNKTCEPSFIASRGFAARRSLARVALKD